MSDYMHEWTDEQLAELEDRIKRTYHEAYETALENANKALDSFKRQDEEMKSQVKSHQISRKTYQQWRELQMIIINSRQDLADSLSRDFLNADQIARGMINGRLPEIFSENYNFTMFGIERAAPQVRGKFSIYDKDTVENLLRNNPDLIPYHAQTDPAKSTAWVKKHINSAVTQGILTGESIPKIARRIAETAGFNQRASIRSARTAVTSAENAGRIHGMSRASEMGINIQKQWLATLDHRTRHSHRQVDGEIQPLNELFSNDCRYPGDSSAPPQEVYNCRCTLLYVVDNHSYKVGDERISQLEEGETYNEWKSSKK